MKTFRLYGLILLFVCLGFTARANDLMIDVLSTSVSETNQLTIELQVEWQHSWNEASGQVNHDAVWLFFKSRALDQKNWTSFKVDSIYSDDYVVKISDDRIGLTLQSNSMSANEPSAGILTLIFSDFNRSLEFYAGGTEIVYVNEGAFFLGDAVSQSSLYGIDEKPINITSEQELISNVDISSLEDKSIIGDVPSNYPKGFEAFYCMKYEVSQAQFCDFLNHLDYTTQEKILSIEPSNNAGGAALFNSPNSFYNGIRIAKSGDLSINTGATFICDLNENGIGGEETDGETLACNFLSWEQLLYYLDWMGLRPISEFEFEKACRGPEAPIERELAFGTAKVIDANTIENDSTELETYNIILNPGFGIAAHGFLGRSGSLRTGFAASENTDRLSSGASYWGIMELSGNLWEQTMSISKINGLLFEGTHGDGDLSSLPSDWMLQSNIVRGGAWNSGISLEFRDLAVSDRFYYDLQSEVARNTTGGRGARSVKTLIEP